MARTTTSIPPSEELAEGIWSLILGMLALVAILIHLYNTQQDLYTKERRTVLTKNGKKPSERTEGYILGAYLKAAVIFFYGVALVSSAVVHNFWIPGFGDCLTMSIIQVTSWKMAIAAQYLVYILNLHQCYPWDPTSTKPFGFKTQKLIGIAVFIVFFAFIFTIGLVTTSVRYGRQEIDADNAWPYNCGYILDPDQATVHAIIFGVLIVIWDVALSIGSLKAYNNSFVLLFDWMKQNKKKDDDASYDKDKDKKLLYTGYKYKILVGCQSITTIIWIVIMFTGQTTLGRMFAGLDFFISMICVMLMTPYYRNDYWFKSLCCLCILCDKDRENYTGKGNNIDDVQHLFAQYIQEIDVGKVNQNHENNIQMSQQIQSSEIQEEKES